MRYPLTYTSFEIQQRQYAPNCVVGITDTGRTVLVAAPGTAMGKQLGDQLALEIKAMLEHKYRLVVLEFLEQTATVMECPNCKHLQKHTYPSSGKLFCAGCGALIEEIDPELDLLSPPGDTIRETMDAMGLDMPVFRRSMGLSVPEAAELLIGQAPITQDIAAKLERVLNVDAQFWLNREANYRAKLQRFLNADNK